MLWPIAVVDRTEPNLPNTEASVRYYSVRFGEIQEYRTESFLLLISIFEVFGEEINYFQNSKNFSTKKSHWNLVTTNKYEKNVA